MGQPESKPRNGVFRTTVDQTPIKGLRRGRGDSRQLIGPMSGGTDSLDLHLNRLEPGSGPGPRHFHAKAENIYWVLDGMLRVDLEDETIDLGVDDLLLIPPGVVHETSNSGPGVAVFVEIYVPAGDDFHIVGTDEDG